MSALTKVQEKSKNASEANFRAFVADDESRKAVEQVVGELMIPSAAVIRGNVRDAIEHLGTTRSPRLLLVDLSGRQLPLSDINELAEVCEPGVRVIAVGDRNDVGLFRELLGQGITDYVVKPVTPALLQRSIVTALDGSNPARETNRLGRLVAVIGARGGVGTTMIAANCAWSIANHRRRRVALLDLDPYFGSVALALDLEPNRALKEALQEPERIDNLFIERSALKHSDTLHVIAAEEALDDTIIPENSATSKLLGELRNKFHFVLADLPRTNDAQTQAVLSDATNVVLVTDLSLAGMRDTVRILQYLGTLDATGPATIVANRVGEHRQGEIGRAEFEKGIGRSIDVVIPFDARKIAAAMNVGEPIANSDSPVAAGIKELASRLCGGDNVRKRSLLMTLFGERK